MTGAGNQSKELWAGEQEVEDLGDEEQQQGL
jgi:hypothetical protein